uniref:Uncharacterized protein n=1 Tax=Noccaea caerulescens TaxID=107243 RepID=A0A1J3D3E7_NOCCA
MTCGWKIFAPLHTTQVFRETDLCCVFFSYPNIYFFSKFKYGDPYILHTENHMQNLKESINQTNKSSSTEPNYSKDSIVVTFMNSISRSVLQQDQLFDDK